MKPVHSLHWQRKVTFRNTSEPVLRMFRRRNTPTKRSYHLWRNGNIFELCSWDSASLKLYLICQNRYVYKWVFYLKVFIFTKPVYCLLILLFELIKLSLELNFKELSLVSWENQAQSLHIFFLKYLFDML